MGPGPGHMGMGPGGPMGPGKTIINALSNSLYHIFDNLGLLLICLFHFQVDQEWEWVLDQGQWVWGQEAQWDQVEK